MPVSVVSRRAGRPDYSQVVEKAAMPLPAKSIVGKTRTIYWSTYSDVSPSSMLLIEPVDTNGNSFPRPNRKLRIKKVVVSIEADTLIGLDLRESSAPYTDWGEYIFSFERGYQRIEISPEAYTIEYPDKFRLSLVNYDPTNERRFYIFLVASEESE